MDESKSPVKTKLSQPRGPKASSAEKSNKEAPAQREAPKSATRSKENLTATKDEHNIGSQGSRGPGKTFTDIPQDKRRGRPPRTTRLTGRTSSGERGKGKAPGSQQKLVAHAPDSNVSLSADNSPLANRETSFPVGPGTRKKDFTDQARSSSATPAKEKSYGGKAAALMHQPVEEQQLGLRQAEERLYRDYIHRLLKQSIEYPNYQYLCKLCSVHIENIQGAHKHIKEKRHKKNIMMRALDAAVLETATQYGISEEDFEVRKALVIKMEEIIKKHLSACALRLYGSCLNRFAFKTSDINIDVTHPSSMTQPEVLIQVLEILKKSSEFSEVESDFHAKVPAVFCRDVSSGLMCKVSAGNDVAWLTTNHMAVLSRLEPRLIPLVMAFRYWARLCHVDCQSEGGLPSYSFALMVIFFLQQRKQPILPVYLGRWIEGFDVKRVDEYHLTGISLDSLVRWERRPPSSTDNRNDNRGEGRPKPEQKKIDDSHFSEGLTRLTLDMGKDVTLGQLWLDLLRFYTLEFALEEHIISIRLKELLSREGKNWPRRRLAIEDPFALKRNVARSLNSQMVFEYLQERFRTAYKYFACPQRRGCGGLQRGKKGGRHVAKLEEVDKKQEDEKVERGFKEDEEPDSDDADGSDPSRKKDEKTLDARLTDMVLNEGGKPSLCPNGLLDSDNEGEEDEDEEDEEISVSDKEGPVLPEDLHYVFDKMIFTGGKPPTVVCSICKRDGHLKDECPEDFKKIELKPLPPMNERFREILDGLCRLCFYKAQLCLFGSSKNGFGFRDSDLDICMTLEGHDTAEMLNCKEIIEGLAKVLKKHTGLRNILPITTAKVPIVKFEHRQSGLEGDISLYNTLAQHNTRMLAAYAALDLRVQFLGYTMKVFAKRCDIGDASRGSLSSYAYILMVLYFLQQRQPPVIPVLQEIFDGNTVPQRMVDGWNAFFCDDPEDLRRLPQPNTESVGELWLGLLRFYTEEFDFKEHVISIRQRKRLTTFEKQWTSKCIAIEVTNFIMKAFINGRKLFGTPFLPIPGTEVDYFFDSKVLTDGELAPNDRCCRICGKIGHYMKDCPKRRRMKKKENEKDEDVKDEEREPKDRRCFQCGDMGHVRRDCPEYRHLKQRTGGAPAPHMVRSVVSSQSIPIPKMAADCPGRTRQPSECSDSRQTPPYSPQPTAVPQSSSPQPSHMKSSPAGPQKQPGGPPLSVPLSLCSASPLPTQASSTRRRSPPWGSFPRTSPRGNLTTLSTSLPPPGPYTVRSSPRPLPAAPPRPASNSPCVRPGNGSPTGSGGNAGPLNLNDPSIIFAQPAVRQLGMGPGREGHWHNHLAQAGALMGNGTVVKSESGHPGQFVGLNPGPRIWEHNKTPQMPQNFIQQGNGGFQPGKPFGQGSMVLPNPNFPMVPHVRHPVNLNFLQQRIFISCLITLICDTNVKYFNTPFLRGSKKVFYFMCK
ncbi:hypothetical protein F7725_028091, partial [Dissostichus mawsoni]